MLSIVLLLLAACSKSEIDTFANTSPNELINIIGEEAEIGFELIAEKELSYEIRALVSGFAVGYDRKINIVATDSTTAIEGEHYTITECIIPANEVEGFCLLTLKEPIGLAEGDSLVLQLEVLKSDKLLPGLKTKLYYKLVGGFPSDWPDSFLYGYFFGDYSKKKYEFLISLFGSVDDVANVANWGNIYSLTSYQFYIYKAFEQYKSDNPDLLDKQGNLLDENGKPVEFPSV